MNEVGMFDYVAVATFGIPFLVGALRWLLGAFNKTVKSETLVGIVCVALGGLYAAFNAPSATSVISYLAGVSVVTFATANGVYKLWRNKNK